jgi:mono/diheme cytochrome c family protein
MFPPLNNLGIWLARPDGRQWIADAVVNGPYGEIAVGGKIYNSGMPGYGHRLSNAQITAVMRYVAETLNAPPAGYTPFVEEMVAAARLVPDDGVSMKAIRGRLPMR